MKNSSWLLVGVCFVITACIPSVITRDKINKVEKEALERTKDKVEIALEDIHGKVEKNIRQNSKSLKADYINLAKDEVYRLANSEEVARYYPGYQPVEEPVPGEYPLDRGAVSIENDHYGDSANRIVYLDQGWTAGDSLWFYTTTQGSELMPYAYFVNFEQLDSTDLFLESFNVAKYRYLPQNKTSHNPDGLPVGFTRNNDSIGLTCAACHTNQVNYQGTGIRIDGGPTMANFVYFMDDLAKIMRQTLTDNEKFDRFAKRVLTEDTERNRDQLSEDFRISLDKLLSYNSRNYSSTEYGFARVDAVGRIYNQVLNFVGGPENSNSPDAPVSYPFLWDTPQHDYVQWIGVTGNAGPGALGRNSGEVVGVFGDIKVKKYHSAATKLHEGYESTVRTDNLVKMEEWLRQLKSPLWPSDIFPVIDEPKRLAGKALYKNNCLECHQAIDRNNPKRRVIAQMYGLDEVKTDPVEIENATTYTGRTGILEGATRPMLGGQYGAEEAVIVMLTDLVEGVIFKHKKDALAASVYAVVNGNGLKDKEKQGVYPPELPFGSLHAYKARPLDGIWATAPYLHNGSVPTLYDLLLPENERPKKFTTGQLEYDPVRVGFVHDIKDDRAPFVFDTTLRGNSNQGHNYGTYLNDEQRWQLVEYLKSL